MTHRNSLPPIGSSTIPLLHILLLPYNQEEFAFWLTTRCEFNFVLADELRRASASELPQFLSLQELRRSRSTWLTRKLITFDDALAGKYVEEYAAMSYR